MLIFIYRNSLQGLGYSREAMLAGVFELIGRVAVASLLVGRFGFTAACFASPAAWVAADALLLSLYKIKMAHLLRREKALKRTGGTAAEKEAEAPAERRTRPAFPHALRVRRRTETLAR